VGLRSVIAVYLHRKSQESDPGLPDCDVGTGAFTEKGDCIMGPAVKVHVNGMSDTPTVVAQWGSGGVSR